MAMKPWFGGISGPPGGNWIFFLNNESIIKSFIEKNKLQPAEIGQISHAGRVENPDTEAAVHTLKYVRDLGINGGIRVAHLHFNDHIYLLNNEQWAQFSTGIINEARERVSGLKTVTFEQGVALGSASQMLRGK